MIGRRFRFEEIFYFFFFSIDVLEKEIPTSTTFENNGIGLTLHRDQRDRNVIVVAIDVIVDI